MKKLIFKIVSLILSAVILLSFSACDSDISKGGGEKTETSDITKLSFKQALGYDYLSSLDGKKVTINGYLATSSPVDGSFIFLMNMPFQNCPFCVPNTSQLSNTMEVYPKDGEKFTYTNQAVKVVGTLVIAPENKPFTDMYGYQFSFKLIDASYTVLKDADMSEELKLWQKFSSTDIINDINEMYNYVNFLCAWNTYKVNSYTDENGKTIPGYYLYPSDAINFIKKDGAQYNYGFKAGYFDDIIANIKAVDETAFADLIENIEAAKTLAQEALSELEAGNYTCEEKFVEEFNTTDKVYALSKGEELQTRMNNLYYDFSMWLGGWEL